jgi:spoIIIJ-associated protein
MEMIDFEGKTIDEAIVKACRQFQVPRERLQIEIIAEANPGFLGFGAKKAVIRASLLQLETEIDSEVNSINEAVHHPESDSRISLNHLSPPPSRPPIKKITHPKRRKKEKDAASLKKDDLKHPSEDTVGKLSDDAIDSKQLLEGLLIRMGFSAEIKTHETQEAIVLRIIGDKDGLIIGKKGQNLDAIQYIVNKAAHHSSIDSKKIVIDTEEYRKRREESLVTTAIRAAEKVKKTKKPATLGPMNPHDRRIIHLAIQDEKTLTTKSRGEGEFRKIVILPAQIGNHHS